MKPEMGPGMPEMPEMMLRAARAAGFGTGLSRREFLFLSAGALTPCPAPRPVPRMPLSPTR